MATATSAFVLFCFVLFCFVLFWFWFFLQLKVNLFSLRLTEILEI